MKVEIKKSDPNGEVIVPPSKSYAHRYLIASFLSKETSKISPIELNEDIKTTINCLKLLGCKIDYLNNEVILKCHNINNEEIVLDCFESGTTLRFLIPIVLALDIKTKFLGSKKLFSRGLKPYLEIFESQNINYILKEDSLILDGKLFSDDFKILDTNSSQFISGLLFALPLLEGDSSITISNDIQSKNYIDITLDVLKKAGILIRKENNVFYIKGNQKYLSNNYLVEADYSNASFIDAFNYLGSNIKLIGLNEDSLQGDKIYSNYFKALVKEKALIDIGNCIDLGPILFVFASLFKGGHFINTKRLKIKESDRINSLKEELKKCNVELIELDNEVIINNEKICNPNDEFNSHNDHRILMALTLLSSRFDIVINGFECVKKSYPSFYEDLEKIGIKIYKVGE